MNENLFGHIQEFEHRAKRTQTNSQGVKHHHRMSPMQPTAPDSPVIYVSSETDAALSHIECIIQSPTPQVLKFRYVTTTWDMLNWRYQMNWQVALPARPEGTLVRYQIKAYFQNGNSPVFADDGEVFSYMVGEMHPPEWAKEAIIYQIFPDRFSPGNGKDWNKATTLDDVFGGTIRGIIDNLDHVEELGCNTIWLNPFFPDHTHHGYHATDYFTVNPRMGTVEDIRELVKKSNEMGIRLILDFVANHWGAGHKIFKKAQSDRDNEFYDWFYWNHWPDDYEMYFNVKDLPKINVDNTAARKHLFDAALFWLCDVGFDGLRCDHANGPAMNFWTELRKVVLDAKPEAWIFGEVVSTPDDISAYQGRLHGCLDFALAQALRDTFGFGSMDLSELDSFLIHHENYHPKNFMRPSFLDNHDMDRFIWAAGNDSRKLKLASLCLLTLPAPPSIYYGTTIGTPQLRGIGSDDSQGYAECRQPMRWGEDQDNQLKDYFKWLIHFRKNHPVLWEGERKTLHLNKLNNTWVYQISNNHESVIVALNLSAATQTISLENDIEFSLAPISGDVKVINNQEE